MLLSCSEKGNTVPGYDFWVNSVWPEIVRGLEENLPSLFNPGNPDAFHEVTSFIFFILDNASLCPYFIECFL